MIHRFRILLIAGGKLWEESEEVSIPEMLEVNGIYTSSMHRHPVHPIVFYQVDPVKTDIQDFYKWEELQEHQEEMSFRTYYTFGSSTDPTEWMRPPLQETIGPYSCQDFLHWICAA